MVKHVMKQGVGKAEPYTLLHWRVPKHAGVKAAITLYGQAEIVESPTHAGASGPKISKIDDYFRLYYRLHLVADHVDFVYSFGYEEGKALQLSESVMEHLTAVRAELQKLVAATGDPQGWYTAGPAGDTFEEPNPVVRAMAEQYLDEADALQTLADGNYTSTPFTPPIKSGKLLQTVKQYKWTDDGSFTKEDKPVVTGPKPYSVSFTTGTAAWPHLEAETDGTLKFMGVNFTAGTKVTLGEKPSNWTTPQFIVKLGHTDTQINFIPPESGWKQAVGESTHFEQSRGWDGMCWAVIAGAPNAAAVARVMNLWEASTRIVTRKAAPAEKEALYWAKQAQIAQQLRARETHVYDGAAEFQMDFTIKKTTQKPHFHNWLAMPTDHQVQVIVHTKKKKIFLRRGRDYHVGDVSKKSRLVIALNSCV
jgi:hypothetical protein